MAAPDDSGVVCMGVFTGAWDVSGSVTDGKVNVTVGRGTVNGFEPIVSGVPIGGNGQPPPSIIGTAEYDKNDRCYICIKIKVDKKTGKMKVPPGEEDLTIKISKHTKLGESSDYWLHPIALITKSGALGQIAYFDYLHFTSVSPSDLNPTDDSIFNFHYFSIA